MALNFPNNPGIGSVFTDTTSGFSYEWDGTVWKSYSSASTSNIRIIDDISGSFNGSTQTFALTVGGGTLIPGSAQSIIITLGGVTQEPGADYTVSGSNITFTTAPEAELSFSGISLGPAIPVTVTTIPDGTITDGDFTVSDDFSVLGFTTTKNLYATGIVTATSGFVGNLTGTATGLSGSPNITVGNVVVGVVTASSFVGNLTGDATGLSGSPNITVGNVVASAGTFTNLTVNGTQTIINTTELNIADKTVGIASTSSASNTTADGAGIVVYGGTDGNKSFTWDNASQDWVLVGGGLSVTDYEGNFILDSYLFN